VCLISVFLALMLYGTLAFGLTAFYFALQSGLLHFAHALEWKTWSTVRHAVAALGIGPCLLMFAFMRGFHTNVYLEHIGGLPGSNFADIIYMFVAHGAAPLLGILHVFRAPQVNPVLPMLLAAAEVSYVTITHGLIAQNRIERVLEPGWDVFILYAVSLASAAFAALLTETAVRVATTAPRDASPTNSQPKQDGSLTQSGEHTMQEIVLRRFAPIERVNKFNF
jgi:hypothetical protein